METVEQLVATGTNPATGQLLFKLTWTNREPKASESFTIGGAEVTESQVDLLVPLAGCRVQGTAPAFDVVL